MQAFVILGCSQLRNIQFLAEIPSVNPGMYHCALHISSFQSIFFILDAKVIKLQMRYPDPLLKILLTLCHMQILLAYLIRSLMKLLD